MTLPGHSGHSTLYCRSGRRGQPAGRSRCCCGAVAHGVTDKAEPEIYFWPSRAHCRGRRRQTGPGKRAERRRPAIRRNAGQDHGDHKTKAEQVAGELGVTPPTGSGIGAKATYAKLTILSGSSFDRSFAKSMVKDHQGHQGISAGGGQERRGRPLWPRRCPSCRNICRRDKSLEKQTAQKQSSR